MAEISAAAVKALREQTGAGMMDCKRALSDAGGEVGEAVKLLRERGLAKAGKREGRATSEGLIAVFSGEKGAGMVELGCETDFVARTDDFGALAMQLATIVAGDADVDGPEALLECRADGTKVSELINQAIAKLGENVVVKRTARLSLDGSGTIGGYVHAGGKLGVLVGLATSASGPAVESLAKDLAMHVTAADPSPVAVTREEVSPQLLDGEREIFRAQAQQEGKPEKILDKIVEGKISKFLKEVVLLEQAFIRDPDRSVRDLLKSVGEEVGAEITVTGFRRFKLGEAGEG